MDENPGLESLSLRAQALVVAATTVDVGKRVLLYCSPSAAVVVLFPRFGAPHYRTLAVTLAALVVALSVWSVAARPSAEDLFVALLSGWFYNMAVFGATVFAVLYAASPVRYVFLLGFPLAAAEFRRHLGETGSG